MDTINNVKTFFASKAYKWILWAVAGLLLLAVVFALGVRVGLHKARYSYQWGENYERNFLGGRQGKDMGRGFKGMDGFIGLRDGNDFRNGHGLAGDIISIAGNVIMIKDNSGKENTVSINDKTIIKSGSDNVKVADLVTGERIVVIGKV